MESIAVTGPTASGKTAKAVALAKALNGEVISADSRQVYIGMDIGTGKDIEEYGDVPHHLIDIIPAGEKYNLHRFIADFHLAYDNIMERGKIPVICGGTGMYLENALAGVRLPDVPENPTLRSSLKDKSLEELTAILSGMKTLHNVTDVDTCQRAIRAIEIQYHYSKNPELSANADRATSTPLDTLIVGMDIPRDDRRRRISERLDARLKSGMIEEVIRLLDSGIPAENLIYYGLEYKFLTLHAIGKISYDEMYTSLLTAIQQFAKRQMTWFRGMERRGFKIHWLPYDMTDDEFVAAVRALINS